MTYRATGSIKINITEIQELGELWDSDILQSVAQSLAQGSEDANAGSITGNRMFYANDYMVSIILGRRAAQFDDNRGPCNAGSARFWVRDNPQDVLQENQEWRVHELAECEHAYHPSLESAKPMGYVASRFPSG